jgi:hypothetical protein
MIPESRSEWFRFYYAFFVSDFKTKSMEWRQVAANKNTLINYLQFYVPLKNISHIWRRHHCRRRAAKFRPMLRAFGQGGIFIVPYLL